MVVRSRSGTITRTGCGTTTVWPGGPWPRPWPLSLSLSLSAQAEDTRPAQSAGTRTTRAMRMVGLLRIGGNAWRARRFLARPEAGDALRQLQPLVGWLGLTFPGDGLFLALARQQAEEQRHEQDGDEGGGQHAADDAGADRMAAGGARAGADGQRQHAEDEGERGHDDRTEAQPGGFDRGVVGREPLLVTLRGELDDQDGVPGGQPDQRHQ